MLRRNRLTIEQLNNANEYLVKERRKGRDVWVYRLAYYAENGTRKATSKAFKPDEVKTSAQAKRAARAWRETLISEARAGAESDGTAPTIAEYMREVVDGSGANDSSKLGYRPYMRRIESRFGSMALQDLTAEDVGAWQADMRIEGLAPNTIRHAHALLSHVMNMALQDGYVPRNVCKMRAAKAPKKPYQEPNTLTADERGRLLAYLSEADPSPVNTAAALALLAGLRRGELCGLRWKDTDLDGATVKIRTAVGKRAGGTYEKAPKTGASIRTVPLPDRALDALRKRLEAMRSEAGAFAPVDSFCWPDLFVLGKPDGSYCNPDVLGHEWAALRKFLNLKGTQRPPTLHDLRHTYITWLVTDGADVKTVASLAGHSDVAHTLNIYAAADPNAQRAAVERLGQLARLEESGANDGR